MYAYFIILFLTLLKISNNKITGGDEIIPQLINILKEIHLKSQSLNKEIGGYIMNGKVIITDFGNADNIIIDFENLPKNIIPFHTHPARGDSIIENIEPPSTKDIFIIASSDIKASRDKNIIIAKKILWEIDKLFGKISDEESGAIATYATLLLSILMKSLEFYNVETCINVYSFMMRVYLDSGLDDVLSEVDKIQKDYKINIIPNVQVNDIILLFLEMYYKRSYNGNLVAKDYNEFKNIMKWMVHYMEGKKGTPLFNIRYTWL